MTVTVSSLQSEVSAGRPSGLTTTWVGILPVGTVLVSSGVPAPSRTATESWPLTAQTLAPSGETCTLRGTSTPRTVVTTVFVAASITLRLRPFSLATYTDPVTMPASGDNC